MFKKNIFLSLLFYSSIFSDTQTAVESAQFQTAYDKYASSVITPSLSPIVKDQFGVNVKANYLLWQTAQDGLRYAMDGVPAVGSTSLSDNQLTQGSLRHPNFQLSSGFQVGLGYDLSYDGWNLDFLYTWLYSHAKDQFSKTPEGETYVGFFTGNPSIVSQGQADNSLALEVTPINGSADWKIHFNVIDMEINRGFFISPKLLLKPFCGLKGTWQTQHFDISYTSIGRTTPIGPDGGTIYLNATGVYQPMQKQKYWGIGPRCGLNLDWLLSKRFSLEARASVSSLWGYFTTSREDVSNVTSSEGIPLLTNHLAVNAAQRVHLVNPVLETMLGFSYDYWFSEDQYRLKAKACWEQQVWFNQNHFFAIFEYINGDLMFQGLTLSVGLDF